MLRRLGLAVLGLVALLLVLAAGLFGLAQTGWAQDRLASFLARQLGEPGRPAEVSGLRGFLPFDLRLARLRLPDADGFWLTIEDAQLRIAPAALLQGRLDVTTLGAARVALDRLPPQSPEPEAEPPFTLPELPSIPPVLGRIGIGRLQVDRLELGAPVLGEPAAFRLDGSAGPVATGPGLQAELALTRIDQPTAALNLALLLDPAADTLRLDLAASETGGLLAAVSGRPEAGALRLDLTGDGPLSAWRGRLDLDAAGLAEFGADLALAYTEAHKELGVTGRLDLAPGLLPAAVMAATGSHADLALEASETGARRYALKRLQVTTQGIALTGSGEADLAADRLAGTARLDLPALAPFSPLAGTPLAGTATLDLTAKGAVGRPELTLKLDGSDLSAAELALQRLTGSFALRVDGPEAAREVALAGSATAEGLAASGRPIADGRLELAVDGSLAAAGVANLRRLALRSSLGEIAASGSIDPASLAGTGRIDARVPELKAVMLAFDAGLPLAGAVELGGDIAIGAQAERIALDLAGKAQGLTGLPPGAQELVGPSPTVAAKAAVEPASGLAIESLALTTTGFRLEGGPSYRFADQGLGGELRLTVPDLALLTPVLQQPVSGAATLRAGLGGTVPAPDLALDARIDRPSLAGERFDEIALSGGVRGSIDAPEGSVLLTATRGRQEVALATAYALAGDLLKLTGLTLNAPATRLAGAAEIALAGPLVRGQLAGESRDLAALRAFTGQAIAGRAKLDLRLTTPQNRQDVAIKLDANDLRADFGSLSSANLALSLGDALGRGGLDGSLRAQGLRSGEATLSDATLKVGGRLAAIDLTANLAGDQAGKPFDLAATAALDVLGARKTIRASKLTGTLAGERLRLVEPAAVTLEGSAVAVDRIALDLGPGKLRGRLQLGTSRVDGELALASLPLATLERFGAPPLAGSGQAKVTLSGTRAAPEIALDASVAKAALDPAAKLRLDGKLAGRLAGGRLAADLSLNGLGAQPLTARVALPARLSLDPPGFALGDSAPLDGSVKGPIDLARIAQVAPLGGIQLAGVLQAALNLSGTLQQPGLAGALDLDNGSVQDVATGIAYRKLALRARAAGDRLTIEQLTGTDPTGGKLQGKGTVRLLAGGGVAYDVTLDATATRLLDNALGNAFISGTVRGTGDLASAQLRGQLTVDRADLQIPDGGGPSVPVIEVKEVNRPGGEPAAPTAPAEPFALAFDVGIDIPGRFFVRGRGLDSEWTGKLTLKGDLADPLVEGELDVRRGYLDLLDRRFTIDRGAIDFVGSRPPVPMVDLAATAQTVEVKVTITLLGPAVDPKITLTSDPQLPQDEILARLLFGTSAARITPMQGIRLAAAVQELQGQGTISGALSRFRRAVGLDTLDVQSTETTDAEGDTQQQTSARVGKYVTDKVYLEVEQNVTDGGSKARVQVDLTPNLSVGSTVSDQSQTGVGLQWRYDY